MDVSDIFYFFLLGEGEGGVRGARQGGDRFCIENPRRGQFRGEGPRGREGVCGELGNFLGGGGAKYFFSGPKCPPGQSTVARKGTFTTRFALIALVAWKY